MIWRGKVGHATLFRPECDVYNLQYARKLRIKNKNTKTGFKYQNDHQPFTLLMLSRQVINAIQGIKLMYVRWHY